MNPLPLHWKCGVLTTGPPGKWLLLLLLSHFSRVRLCATPETAAHQAPPSLGFSRQEHGSGLPFPSPMQESENKSEVAQSCPTLSDPTDCSLPGSSVHGIFQARVLEWGAMNFKLHMQIAFSFPQTALPPVCGKQAQSAGLPGAAIDTDRLFCFPLSSAPSLATP